MEAQNTASLRTIKTLHTAVWAFFACCIFAIPVYALLQRIVIAAILIAVVLVEVLVLAFNRMSCPLTGIASAYTEDRRDNFDIYLPEWLARYNKVIFGLLYLMGILVTIAEWRHWLPSFDYFR
jgi:hypothetical protein